MLPRITRAAKNIHPRSILRGVNINHGISQLQAKYIHLPWASQSSSTDDVANGNMALINDFEIIYDHSGDYDDVTTLEAEQVWNTKASSIYDSINGNMNRVDLDYNMVKVLDNYDENDDGIIQHAHMGYEIPGDSQHAYKWTLKMNDVDKNNFDDFEIGIFGAPNSSDNYAIRKNGRIMTRVCPLRGSSSRSKYIKNFEIKNGDVIELKIDFKERTMSVVKNGEDYGVVIKDMELCGDHKYKLFISCMENGTSVEMKQCIKYSSDVANNFVTKFQEISNTVRDCKEFVGKFPLFSDIMTQQDNAENIRKNLETIDTMMNNLLHIQSQIRSPNKLKK